MQSRWLAWSVFLSALLYTVLAVAQLPKILPKAVDGLRDKSDAGREHEPYNDHLASCGVPLEQANSPQAVNGAIVLRKKPLEGSKQFNARFREVQGKRPVKVACVGDSITFGYGLDDRDENSYPAQLQQLLGDRYEVGNFGLSGSGVLKNAKLAGTGWRRCYANHIEYHDSVAFKPQLVIINLGINDVVHWNELGEEFVGDYVELIQAYKDLPTKPKVFIWHRLTPLFAGQTFFGDANVDKLNAAIAEAAERIGVQTIDLYAPFVDHPEWFPDQLHPNPDGAKRIAEVVAHAIVPNHFVQSGSQISANESRIPLEARGCSFAIETGFEENLAGPLRSLKTAVGQWEAEDGHATIHVQNANRGKQSLRLLGGEDRIVEFTPKVDDMKYSILSFWVERWTGSKPFSFRVEKLSGGKWLEIYNGDDQVKVGGFLTKVAIDVPELKGARYRFRSTTPPKSGVLIDDVSIAAPTPMSIADVASEQPPLPILLGKRTNPVSRIRVDVDGNSGPRPIVESLTINTHGSTELVDIEKVEIFYTGTVPIPQAWDNSDSFAGTVRFGQTSIPEDKITFDGHQALKPGPNYFWVSYTLQPSADIDHVVDAACELVALDGGTSMSPQVSNPEGAQRLGVAVRKRGDDGAHTYRIPGLATTNKGTLIGVYDIRHRQGGDLPGDIDVGMSRSVDGGRTWEPMQVIMDMGSDPQWNYDGIGDPAVLVDRQTNAIWVAGIWSHGNRGWHGSGPGMLPEETGQLMLVRSDDDGKTWSEPVNITAQVKRPDSCFLLQGPGKGISMRDGTLVFPAQFQDSLENKRLARSTIIFSRDRGKTWKLGTGAFDDTTEAQVVEVEPGVLMLNCRYNRGKYRVVMITRDMGITWQEHPTSRKALLEPGACMGSLINIDQELGRSVSDRLLFSNPNSSRRRERISIKMSTDGGNSWPESQQLLLDAGVSAGYSCMTMIDDDTVGILYEGSQAHMTFQRIKLSDISDRCFAPSQDWRVRTCN